MPFCPKCGTEYQEGTKFCGKCGENVGTAAAVTAVVSNGNSFFQKILNTKDVTAQLDANDINQNKAMAILAFCGVFAYIVFNWVGWGLAGLVAFAGLMVAPCIAYKKSQYLKFVLSQVYVAFFGVLLFGILDGAISSFFFNLICPAEYQLLAGLGLGGAQVVIATLVSWLIHVVFMAIPLFVLIVGFINVINGKAKGMPFIGKIKVTFEK